MYVNLTDIQIEQAYNTVPRVTFEGEILYDRTDVGKISGYTPNTYRLFLEEVIARRPQTFSNGMLKIKNVIFNAPATIVFWSDGTKTVVKAQDGDIFDPEKGLAMAISKKALGNKGNYCNELKKWLPKEEETWQPITMTELADGVQKLGEAMGKTFGVKAKKSCSTCKLEHVLSAKCISCKGRGYVNHTPKNETEAE